MNDTIFARSSGSPPAAIGLIRVSGAQAGRALEALAGPCPEPRRASLRTLRHAGEELDSALVLWFPGPDSATGEDCAEFHCHGGRAVLAAVEHALASQPGLRMAEPGEFTRRAFLNGRIDLAQAEGLADLLAAETEIQRRSALANASGAFSREVEAWRKRVLILSAEIEASLDFAEEDEVGDALPPGWAGARDELLGEIETALARPPAERLRDGIRVVLAGPPNAGKSSLFNALLADSAAIVSEEAGTTRDAIERPIALAGIPFVLVDTAGLRDEGAGTVEAMGIARTKENLDRADIVLWLGDAREAGEGAILVAAKCDLDGCEGREGLQVSSHTGEGLGELVEILVSAARALLPKPYEAAINARQRTALQSVLQGLHITRHTSDLLLIAEGLRQSRRALDAISGRASTEDMLDTLFGRFCIGK